MANIVEVYQSIGDLKKVDLSINYQVCVYGSFTAEEDKSFKFRHLMNLTGDQANSVKGLVNSCYEMGYRQAKREIAFRLGLL